MAKKRDIQLGKFNITEAGCELVARITFSLKLFEGDIAVEHVAGIDLSMGKDKLLTLALSTIVIDLQKILRGFDSHAKVREFLGKTLMLSDIYPGKTGRVSVARDMSPDEIRAKCKNDPDFRKALMAELAEMEDEDAAVNAA